MAVAEAFHPSLKYLPAPSVDPSFWERFNKIVPISPNQVDRMLRFVWGMDRLEYVSGLNVRRYADTDNLPAKYVGRERFVLEGWQSPEVFDKEEWLKNEQLLGPFPENGYWDFIEYHEDAQENYLPLDNSALVRVESWACWRSKGDKRSIEFLMQKKMRNWAIQERNRQEAADAVAQDFGEQYVRLTENEKNAVSTSGSGRTAYTKTQSGLIVPK